MRHIGLIIVIGILAESGLVLPFVHWRVSHGAEKLSAESFETITKKYELSLVNFYHRDCPHSEMFNGVYDQVADIIREEYPDEGKVLLAKIDCSGEKSLIEDQDIVKFPTVRMFLKVSKFRYEYRGPRTIDALLEYIRFNLKDPVTRIEDLRQLNSLNWRKRNVIGYFENENSTEYESFRSLSIALRHVCDFFAVVGDLSAANRKKGNKVVYREVGNRTEIAYTGSLENYVELYLWATIHKCIKMVSEMTLESAEEAAEYQMTHLILFHHHDDTETVATFHTQILMHLIHEFTRMKFVTADASLFSAPLERLGKTEKDLPLVAIDTYQHMYLWPHDASKDLSDPHLLKQFVDDLHSGKLHEQFHEQQQHEEEEKEEHTGRGLGRKPKAGKPKDLPIESQFVKLGPSASKYTFVQREEL